jgi:hypothetical protein
MIQENKSIQDDAQSLQMAVSGSVTRKVVVMEFGEPRIKNVIDVNYETRQVQLQTEGHFGRYWTSFDRCMSQIEIDWFYLQEASAEINRLQVKRTILESSSITDR